MLLTFSDACVVIAVATSSTNDSQYNSSISVLFFINCKVTIPHLVCLCHMCGKYLMVKFSVSINHRLHSNEG